jgi:hypothetical protein
MTRGIHPLKIEFKETERGGFTMHFLRSMRLMVLAFAITLVPASSFAGVFISVNFGPPVMPVYVQPVCPAPNLFWTPGYWAYGPDGYYWVPGAWVPAPYVGALWTPGYWGWGGGLYAWHPGYWGAHVGYYGGVNYGFGYMGIGFAGGEWRGGVFAYNTAVMNVNTTIIHNTYIDRTIVEHNTIVNNNHVAYSGGPGGINHPMTEQERTYSNEPHVAATSFQTQHEHTAQSDKGAYFNNNHGHPANVAVSKPLQAENHPAPQPHAMGSHPGGAQPMRAGEPGHNPTTTQTTHPQPMKSTEPEHSPTNAQPQSHAQPAVQHAPPPKQPKPQPQEHQKPEGRGKGR